MWQKIFCSCIFQSIVGFNRSKWINVFRKSTKYGRSYGENRKNMEAAQMEKKRKKIFFEILRSMCIRCIGRTRKCATLIRFWSNLINELVKNALSFRNCTSTWMSAPWLSFPRYKANSICMYACKCNIERICCKFKLISRISSFSNSNGFQHR